MMQFRTLYHSAPYFQQGYELMQKIFAYSEKNLAYFLEHSMQCFCDYLEIKTRFLRSSEIPHNAEYKKEYRIFEQCKYVGADVYINAIGGQKLYSYEQFREKGIKLGFIKTGDIQYKQYRGDFVPNLSIIDVIMFNSKEEIQQMLSNYTILWEGSRAD